MPRTDEPEWFPLYADAFTSDGHVEAMSTREVGAYMLLLCKAWREKPPGSIPNDDRVLARWSRLTPDEWAECRTGVLSAFKLMADSRWHQTRLRLEYDKAKKLIVARSVAGKKGAAEKWQTHAIANGNGMAKPMANPPTSDVPVLVSVSVNSPEKGMQGEKPPDTATVRAPPAIDGQSLPDGVVELLKAWQRDEYVNSVQVDKVAALVNDYGMEVTTNAMRAHIESGEAKGKWAYLTGICKRMARGDERPGKKSAADAVAEYEQRKAARRDKGRV